MLKPSLVRFQVWALDGDFPGGKIGVIGNPKGSGTWNEDSLENTQNTSPETPHRRVRYL